MSDLIERDKVIGVIDRCKYRLQGRGSTYEFMLDMMKAIPSARPKGKWIWSPRDMDGTVSGCCSNCSFSHLFIGGHTAQYNFCPNCGADMRGERSGTDKDKFEQ